MYATMYMMGRMVRKQVYLDPKHERMLKRRARERGVTEAEIIREALDRSAEIRRQPRADPDAGRKLIAAIRSLPSRSRARAVPSRDALYKERIGRWTKS